MAAIDWAAVNWPNVVLLSVFAFVAAFIDNLVSFNRRFLGAILAGLLFAAFFIFWTYYPHGLSLPQMKAT